MDKQHAAEFGAFLRTAREEAGLTAMQLSQLTGTSDASIIRIEQGQVRAPAPDRLIALAEALSLSPADVFARAGYTAPTDLPDLVPYLRAKHRDLTEKATTEIEASANRIAKKHGIDIRAPKTEATRTRPRKKKGRHQ